METEVKRKPGRPAGAKNKAPKEGPKMKHSSIYIREDADEELKRRAEAQNVGTGVIVARLLGFS